MTSRSEPSSTDCHPVRRSTIDQCRQKCSTSITTLRRVMKGTGSKFSNVRRWLFEWGSNAKSPNSQWLRSSHRRPNLRTSRSQDVDRWGVSRRISRKEMTWTSRISRGERSYIAPKQFSFLKVGQIILIQRESSCGSSPGQKRVCRKITLVVENRVWLHGNTPRRPEKIGAINTMEERRSSCS